MIVGLRIIECLKDRRGVTAVEYGLIAGLIAVALIAGATIIGHELTTIFTNANNGLTGAGH